MVRSRIDPYKWGIVERRGPYDFLGERRLKCPHCSAATDHEGFRTFGSRWVGFGLPFGRRSTAGKIGKRVTMWVCVDCHNITEIDDG